MNSKIASILEKVSKERSRGTPSKALKRLSEAIEKFPGELQLYKDAIELSLEAGEQLQCVQFFKKASSRFVGEREMLWEFAMMQLEKYSDPILGKYLLEQSLKTRQLLAGYRVVQYLDERTAKDLLSRTRKKKETLSSALRGGHALSWELVANTLSEAFLNLRTGNISDAVHGFVRHLEVKPEECAEFEPLLQELEKAYAKKGAVRYALGICFLRSKQTEKGVRKITQALKLSPGLAENVARQLETVRSESASPPQGLETALVETYLIQEDAVKASTLARSILEKRPHEAQLIFDLIHSFLDQGTESWELEHFYLETLLKNGQSQRALNHIKKLCGNPEKKRDIYDWLEAQRKTDSLPVDIQLFFGEEVLKEGRTDWALSILEQAAKTSPTDKPTVVHILDKYRQSNPAVEGLVVELGGAKDAADEASGFDIQYIERSEFSLSNFDKDAGNPAPETQERSHSNPPESAQFEVQPDTLLDSAREAAVEIPDNSPKEAVEEIPKTAAADPLEKTEQAPPPPRLEKPTDEAPDDPSTEPAFAEPLKTEADVQERNSSTTAPQKNAAALNHAEDFDFAYQCFLSGAVDNSITLSLIERALDLGRHEEAKTMLSFRPQTIEEKDRRALLLAEYHCYHGQPLPALIALKTIDIKALPEKEKREYLTKMVVCYRKLNMFEAAQSVLINMMNDYPSDLEIEKLAKKNYEDYLKECCEEATVLEKEILLSQ